MYRQCILVKWFSHCIIDILFSDHHKNWYKRNCDAKKYPISLSTLYADVIPFPLKVSSGPPYRVYFVKGWQPEIQLLTRKLTESNYIEKEDKPTSVFSFISLSNSMRDKKDNDNKRNAVSERTLSFPETRRKKTEKVIQARWTVHTSFRSGVKRNWAVLPRFDLSTEKVVHEMQITKLMFVVYFLA